MVFGFLGEAWDVVVVEVLGDGFVFVFFEALYFAVLALEVALVFYLDLDLFFGFVVEGVGWGCGLVEVLEGDVGSAQELCCGGGGVDGVAAAFLEHCVDGFVGEDGGFF